jgi:CRISPR-associated helicase Cas3/CRISPR-associated endonuclease Cas3-HD
MTDAREPVYFAHTTRDDRPWEPLETHLRLVAERTSRHAAVFGAGDEACLAGTLHDLGKYGDLFQKRLRGEGSGLDHWSLGAWAALQHARRNGWAAALAIEGHHIGLQKGLLDRYTRLDPASFASTGGTRGSRLSEDNLERALSRLGDDGLAPPAVSSSCWSPDLPATRAMLAVRMLFSALVDADFIETEAFMNAAPDGTLAYRPEGPGLEAAEALARLTEKLATLQAGSQAAPHVVRMRADLLADCLAAAAQPRATFTLTAPPGAGQTLSMLAFALRHAEIHGLRRIVFAIPFLSIIEQTAQIYGDLFADFPDHYVLEHHSLSDDGDTRKGGNHNDRNSDDVLANGLSRDARLLAENWDAPLVVTTNVQVLESLFAHKPRRCRKLHNLAGSVILFDEVQTLPPHLARPTLAALGTLVRDFGCSVVFSTATQPAFDHLDQDVRQFAVSSKKPESVRIGWQPGEIVRNVPALFARAKRTQIAWETNESVSWHDLAIRMAEHEQALVIVNLKKHARALAEALHELDVPDLVMLSTDLCPAHRKAVLARVRQRLDDHEPCLLVSTQCIEAGVDIDFPTVFRALGPLESIAQAAGRCNRNGKQETGQVVVFRPEDEKYPPGVYEKATTVTQKLLADHGGTLSIDDPAVFRAYYQAFYALTGEATADDTLLEEAVRDVSFPEVDQHYRIIDQATVNVVVPYDNSPIHDLRNRELDRQWIRDARAYTVGIYLRDRNAIPAGLEPAPTTKRGEKVSDWLLVQEGVNAYDELFGLTLSEYEFMSA